MKLLIVNGANLNLLGKRDKTHYGTMTLLELESAIAQYAKAKGVDTEFFCSQYEGGIIEKLQQTDADGILLNAGAYSHYSYAIRDCIEAITPPVVEVHLSDIMSREDFRKTRVFDGVVKDCFCGNQIGSYFAGIDWFINNK